MEEVGETSEATDLEVSQVGRPRQSRQKKPGNHDKVGVTQNTNQVGKEAQNEKPVTNEFENPHGAPEPDEVDIAIDDPKMFQINQRKP